MLLENLMLLAFIAGILLGHFAPKKLKTFCAETGHNRQDLNWTLFKIGLAALIVSHIIAYVMHKKLELHSITYMLFLGLIIGYRFLPWCKRKLLGYKKVKPARNCFGDGVCPHCGKGIYRKPNQPKYDICGDCGKYVIWKEPRQARKAVR